MAGVGRRLTPEKGEGEMKKKLMSRKLWAAAAGVAAGLAMVFGLDETVVSTVAGGVVSLASLVSYIFAESAVDAAAVRKGDGE